MTWFRLHGPALVLFVTLTLAGTYPLWMSPVSRTLDGGVDQYLTAWMLAWDYHALTTHPTRVFDANIFYPHSNSLAYGENLLGTAILVSPVFFFEGPALLANHIAVILTFFLSATSAYLLAFELLRRRMESIVAGFIFGFAPYRYYHLSHLQVLSSFWIPLAFLFLVRYARTRRAGFAFAAFMCLPLQALSCAYYAVFLSFGMALFIACLLVVKPDRPRLVRQVALAAIIPAMTLAVIHMPYAAVEREQGATRSEEQVMAYGADLTSYLAAPSGHWAHRLTRRFGQEERYLYLGVVAVLLSLPGFWRSSSMLRFFGLLGTISLVFTFGDAIRVAGQEVAWAPYYFVYRFWPGAGGIRAIPRWSVFLFLAIALGAGAGFGRIRRRSRALAMGVAILVYLDYVSWPIALSRAESVCSDAYAYLGGLKDERPLAEVPSAGWWEELRHQYGSTLHWKPLLLGQNGFLPGDHQSTSIGLDSFPGPESMHLLNSFLPVPRVLVHLESLDPEEVNEIRGAIGTLFTQEAAPDDHHVVLAPMPHGLPERCEGWSWRGRRLSGWFEVDTSNPNAEMVIDVDGAPTRGPTVHLENASTLTARVVGDRRYPDRLVVVSERHSTTIDYRGTTLPISRSLWCAVASPTRGMVLKYPERANGTARTVRVFVDHIEGIPDRCYVVFGVTAINDVIWKKVLLDFLRTYGATVTDKFPSGNGGNYVLIYDQRTGSSVFERLDTVPIVFDSAPDSACLTGFSYVAGEH